MPEAVPTRQRLLDEGMRLFAERGFRATPVGDIEAAAGLQPRRGALYKHFPSKQALLEAAVRAYLDNAAAGAAEIGEIDLREVAADRAARHAVVSGVGRWFLDEMDRLRDLTLVLEHDGRRLRVLTAEVKDNIVDLSYRTAAKVIAAAAPGVVDAEALAVVVLGPLVALRRTAWTFGRAPLDIDDDRALAAWTEMVLATLNAAGADDRS